MLHRSDLETLKLDNHNQAISKWAVEALGEALRLELNKYNIDVSAFFAKHNFIL